MSDYEQIIERRILDIKTSQELTLLCAQCMAMLKASSARQRELIDQGHIARFFRNITGQNRRLSQSVTTDVITAQQLAQEMLGQLATRQLFTMQMTSALNQKVNELQLENDQKSQYIMDLLQKVYTKSSTKWSDLQRDLAKIETNVRIMRWAFMHDSVNYKVLEPAAFVLTVAHDFYEYAEGNWQEDDLLCLKKLLTDYEVPTKLALSDYLKYPLLIQRLFQLVRPLPQKDELYLSELVQALRGSHQIQNKLIETQSLLFELLDTLVLIQELTKPTVIHYEVELSKIERGERIHLMRVLHLEGISSEESRQLVRAEQAVVVKSYRDYREALALKKALEEHKCLVRIHELEYFI